jgi:hypothetical protein
VTAQCYCWASQARFAGPNLWRTTFPDLEETEDGLFAFGELLRHLPFAPFIRHLNPYRRKICDNQQVQGSSPCGLPLSRDRECAQTEMPQARQECRVPWHELQKKHLAPGGNLACYSIFLISASSAPMRTTLPTLFPIRARANGDM